MDSTLSMPYSASLIDERGISIWEADSLSRFRLAWSVSIQGTCVRVRRKTDNYNPLCGENRKECSVFTWGARIRMLRFMNTIDWTELPQVLFATLTYPDEIVQRTSKERSKDRFLWHRYLETHLKHQVAVIWRVEWAARKSGELIGQLLPHWHLLILTSSYIHHRDVRDWWRKSIKYEGGFLATDIKRVSGTEGAIRYVAKYTAKAASLDIVPYRNNNRQTGRHWGVLRKNLINFYVQRNFEDLNLDQIALLQAYGRSRSERYDEFGAAGFTALGGDAVKIVKEILNTS